MTHMLKSSNVANIHCTYYMPYYLAATKPTSVRPNGLSSFRQLHCTAVLPRGLTDATRRTRAPITGCIRQLINLSLTNGWMRGAGRKAQEAKGTARHTAAWRNCSTSGGIWCNTSQVRALAVWSQAEVVCVQPSALRAYLAQCSCMETDGTVRSGSRVPPNSG